MLDKLNLLEDGWLNGTGFAPKNNELTWFTSFFNKYYNDSLPLPALFPTFEGGLQAEWSANDWEISLEINLQTQKAEYHALQLSTSKVITLNLDLNKEEDWKQLNEEILNNLKQDDVQRKLFL